MCAQFASSLPDGFACDFTHLRTCCPCAFSLTQWHRSTNACVGTNLSPATGPHQKTCAGLVATESLITNTKPQRDGNSGDQHENHRSYVPSHRLVNSNRRFHLFHSGTEP